MRRMKIALLLLALPLAGGLLLLVPLSVSDPEQESVASPPPIGADSVTALGRLEPKDGLIRLAGPSQPSVVIERLLVEEGDPVEKGQVIALLDTVAIHEAMVSRLEAELATARSQLRRKLELYGEDVLSEEEREAWQLKVEVARAELHAARAELERAHVRSPISGQVIAIHAREGERVGPEGICELGRTGAMYAVAEVYETDVGKVKVGQHATVTSPALVAPLHGTVDRVGLKVGRVESVEADPAARADARVVEVEVRLDESALAAGLTNLQVEVRIALDERTP
jgi:multidrug efflux pump subunit AcrA (membrane-fusion protein)